MQPNAKPLAFNGTAGGYFVVILILIVLSIIPVIGTAMGVHILAKWMVENSTVNGKSLTYNASFADTTIYVLIRLLLVVITLGIYTFWAVPQIYRFVYEHSSVGEAPAPVTAPQPVPTPENTDNSAPVNPAETAAEAPTVSESPVSAPTAEPSVSSTASETLPSDTSSSPSEESSNDNPVTPPSSQV